jgi:hypothetical protein
VSQAEKTVVMFWALAIAGFFVAASCDQPAARPVPDVVVTSTDAGTNPCAKQAAITDARMIATESGAPLVVPCP